jgi:hypothetical protein
MSSQPGKHRHVSKNTITRSRINRGLPQTFGMPKIPYQVAQKEVTEQRPEKFLKKLWNKITGR